MSRRSARLVSGGYYPDEDSDSSSITNISYRETPVKVVKRKGLGRKPARPSPSSQATSYVGRTGSEPAVIADQSDDTALESSQDLQVMRTVPYAAQVTPRPAIVLSAASAPDWRKVYIHSVAAPPERNPSGGAAYHHQQPQNQRGVESSGYSSSEDFSRRAAANAITTNNVSECKSSGSSSSRSVSSVVAAAQTRIMFLAALANASFNKTGMKKAICLLLFLIILLLGFWFLFLLFSATKTPTPAVSNSPPVLSVCPPSSPLQAMPPAPVLDPAVVSAVVEEKMESLLGELMLKQESLYSQMAQRLQVEQRLQVDMQSVRAKMEAVDSNSQARLEREVGGLSRRLADYHADLHSAISSLSDQVRAAEGQSAKLTQELSSLQMRPPPAPCPDPSPVPDYNQLTPELQQAMEKWFADRVKEQEQSMDRLCGKDCSSDCGRPMADRMADFALESQGASVVSTRCSVTYRIRSACMTLFGFPLWYPSESPRTVIQGYPVLLPGKCWAFHGVQGTLLISLSHPVRITHVTLDHLPRFNSPTGRIDSAPRDFQVYGMINDNEEGTLLGDFTYDEDGEPTQTFEITNNSSDVAYRLTELRVLGNWGHMEYTCVYRFRVHGKMAST